ncbi:galectin-8 isoform X3 [Dendroctonus ponderosae]|uniref:galectin-8 isoform X3 n=1 Tax=Dendroctonus ponderosae TaxID=77166 RepID=UPI0020352D2C|nr:galectin-8 isoform X3 [Dendroctonus ponderosae]
MPVAIEAKSKRKGDTSSCCCFPKLKKCEKGLSREDNMEQKVTKQTEAAYTQDLSDPLRPGSCIVLRGTVRPQCKRFAVNFLYVRGHKTDIVFHFNPRLALRYIVRNSRFNNSWGEEESTSVEKFHLNRNKTFELQIVTTDHEFLVALDGRHICAYVYRTSLEKVNKIEVEDIDVQGIEVFQQIKSYHSVDGAIDVESLNQQQVEAYPLVSSRQNPFMVPMAASDGDTFINQQLVVPVTAQLPTSLKPGWQLEIMGRVKILPSAFYINLQDGNTLWPHPMIPLHLNPRFYTSYGNHMFVRNTWMNGSWGEEERTPGFQFTPGKRFHLAIRMNPDNFGVWIDDILAGEFRFRTPTETINTVYIHGDVQIKNIYLKDHIDDKNFGSSKEKLDPFL